MKILLSNKVYDVLKWVCLIVLPAFAALYSALAGAWDWPYTREVLITLSALETFIGALTGVSTAQYNKAADHE